MTFAIGRGLDEYGDVEEAMQAPPGQMIRGCAGRAMLLQ
jgi:hypothetical protein